VNAAKAVTEARAAGILLSIDGDDLVLAAATPPPPALLELLSQHKPAIVLWLRPGADGWSAEDWQVFFDERAGIAEFDGGLPREQAEARAFSCCVPEWLNRNPVRSPPGRCLACNTVEHSHDPLLPFGDESAGHAWLHSRCWRGWSKGRKAESISALAAIGIAAPAERKHSKYKGTDYRRG
jgi:hypothetical protein